MSRPPRLHAAELVADVALVRRMIDTQFPHWTGHELRPAASGTDNVIMRLGADFGVRLPRTADAVAQLEKESAWLDVLAPRLPVDVPRVVARGEPADRFPWPWQVYAWVPGETVLDASDGDERVIARDVAGLLERLRALRLADPPRAGYRGGPLAPHDAEVRAALDALRDEFDHERALAVWAAACAAPAWAAAPVWVHGDLLPPNVVVRGGRVTGVIDWAATGVGDPACDLMIAWALEPSARETLRAGVDDATWRRAAGWVVQQTALYIPYYRATLPRDVAAARRRLTAVLTDATLP